MARRVRGGEINLEVQINSHSKLVSFHNVKQVISHCESSFLNATYSFHIPFHMNSHLFTIRFTVLSVSHSFHSPFHIAFHMISHHFTFHFTGSFHIVSQIGNLRFTCFHKYEISISPNFTGYVKLQQEVRQWIHFILIHTISYYFILFHVLSEMTVKWKTEKVK